MKNYLKSVSKASIKTLCVILLSSGGFQAMNSLVLNGASTAHAENVTHCTKGC